MEKSEKLKKFLTLVSDEKTDLLEKIEWRKANRQWLTKSGKIAFKILRILRKNREENRFPCSQVELAELMKMKPQQINIILKGNENLTLETISRFELALNIQIIDVISESREYITQYTSLTESMTQNIAKNVIINENEISHTTIEYSYNELLKDTQIENSQFEIVCNYVRDYDFTNIKDVSQYVMAA